MSLREDQIAIIKILGDENPLRPHRPFEHRLVRYSFCPASNPLDVMSDIPQFGDDEKSEALVHQVPHALFGRFRMGGERIPQMVSRELVCRQNVLFRQAWILPQDFRCRQSSRSESQYILDSNARSANCRFPEPDFRIGNDSLLFICLHGRTNQRMGQTEPAPYVPPDWPDG